MFRWKATAAASVIVASLALAGCSPADEQAEASPDLVLSAIIAPTTLDPAGSEWGNRAPFYEAVFDTLIRQSPDGELLPSIATEWVYDDAQTELTLTIREGVEFTDGTPLDAAAVVANLERFQSGTSPDAGYFAGVTSFDAPDATTVVITLGAPDPAMLNYLSRDAGLIASPASFDSADLATNPVGSGPYMLDAGRTVTGTSYVYTANPDYWNPEEVLYETLTINVLSDPTAALNAIKAGEANGVRLINNDSRDEIEAAGWTIETNELDFQGFLLLDRAGTVSEPLGDVRVRQAINYAVDREGLLQALAKGYGTVTQQVFPESSAAYDPELDSYYEYDPEKAKELLAEAGYPDGFSISMPSSTFFGAAPYTIMAQQLADVGITAEYTDPGNNFIADLLAPKFPAAFMSLEQNSDWQLIQFMISPTAVFNPYKYADPEVDALIATVQTGTEEERNDAAAEINRIMVEDAWFAPFYRVEGGFAVDANTTARMLPTNAYPSLFDIEPAS